MLGLFWLPCSTTGDLSGPRLELGPRELFLFSFFLFFKMKFKPTAPLTSALKRGWGWGMGSDVDTELGEIL